MHDHARNAIRELVILPEATLLAALKQMDAVGRKLLLVMRGDRFLSVVSIGDLQRAIIRGKPFETCVTDLVRSEIKVGRPEQSDEERKRLILDNRMEFLPVVDAENKLLDVLFWEDIVGRRFTPGSHRLGTVVIMAGGQGKRMRPLTTVIPKALVPVVDKPIIHEIVNRFQQQGATRFIISINYKGDMIERYFAEQAHVAVPITFIREDRFTGTIGSLSLMRQHLTETFFVTNCDILVEQDYGTVLEYHRNNRNDMTIVTALKHVPIPYGIVEMSEGGMLKTIREKPDLVISVNAGMYLIEPHLVAQVPSERAYDVTAMIDAVKDSGGRIGVFPISERSWMDIGEWSEYQRTQGLLLQTRQGNAL